jgi:hypothetical protein
MMDIEALTPLSTILSFSKIAFYSAGAIAAMYGIYKTQKTFSQPQETEIFKAQFSQFDSVMSFLSSIRGFGKESEIEIALQEFRKINYFMIADYFQFAFLGIEIDAAVSRIYEEFEPGEYNAFFHGDNYLSNLNSQVKAVDRKLWQRIQDWSSFSLISISPKYLDDIQVELKSIISSSYLLPSDVRKMLGELSKFIAERKYSSYCAVQKIAPLLPDVKYPGTSLKEMICGASSQSQRDEIFDDYYKHNFIITCKEERTKDTKIAKKIEEIEEFMRMSYKLDKLLIGGKNR